MQIQLDPPLRGAIESLQRIVPLFFTCNFKNRIIDPDTFSLYSC
jgi:hypothetical protein